MTELGGPADRYGGSGGTSTGEQAKEKARETSEQVQAKVREGAGQVRGQVGERVREQVDTRSTQAGEQVASMADAMRRTGEQLRSEGKEGPAKLSEQAAERAERLGGYLRESDADRILRDAEEFARRRPWVVGAGGVVVGFLASRFLKASSSRRYQSSTREGATAVPAGSGAPGPLPGDESTALPRGTAREPVGASTEWSAARPADAPAAGGPGVPTER
ncbi:MAG TPA: hypothetical protein VHF23_05980 [Gaiellaceae bacterium]|nr:hypothetical protein [Gaiellaceae bacterium]